MVGSIQACYRESKEGSWEEGASMNGTQLLRSNRNYRNLWLASVGSQFGNWFNEVALAQVTLTLTHSPAVMGFVLLCRSMPSVILGPLGGPFVDIGVSLVEASSGRLGVLGRCRPFRCTACK